jgi:hypothetical protein
MQQQEREIQRGIWLYGGTQARGVIINAINYDYYHELEKPGGFFDLSGEVPVLNDQGEMYLLEWTDVSFTQQESLTRSHRNDSASQCYCGTAYRVACCVTQVVICKRQRAFLHAINHHLTFVIS